MEKWQNMAYSENQSAEILCDYLEERSNTKALELMDY